MRRRPDLLRGRALRPADRALLDEHAAELPDAVPDEFSGEVPPG
jgi:hypothetical protein